MKIDLNKDFEEQYKNELWKGFTARELLYGSYIISCNVEASRSYMARVIKKYLVLYADKGTAL